MGTSKTFSAWIHCLDAVRLDFSLSSGPGEIKNKLKQLIAVCDGEMVCVEWSNRRDGNVSQKLPRDDRNRSHSGQGRVHSPSPLSEISSTRFTVTTPMLSIQQVLLGVCSLTEGVLSFEDFTSTHGVWPWYP